MSEPQTVDGAGPVTGYRHCAWCGATDGVHHNTCPCGQAYWKKTPLELATEWFDVKTIKQAIRQCTSQVDRGPLAWPPVPTDVYSHEFAEWLTDQFRQAMAKGIQIGRMAR